MIRKEGYKWRPGRAVPDWVGKSPDAAIPPRVKLRVFLRFDCRCQCGCNRIIAPGELWQCDHKEALINGGRHEETNLQPILVEHHKNKTKADVAEKAKTYRRRAKHVGIRKAPRHRWGYGKNDPLKKKVTGELVRRQ